MIDWPSQDPVCYVFGVPRILNGRLAGLTEATLLTVTSEPGAVSSVWVPVAVERAIAEAYHRYEQQIGHSVIRLLNTDGLWALWLELLHMARRFEAEGIMVIQQTEPELQWETFPTAWFLRQYLSRCRALHHQSMTAENATYLKGVN